MFHFNGFTQKANDAVNLAIAQASALGHTYIGSEHLLLGLVSAERSTACIVLAARGIEVQDVTEGVVRSAGRAPRCSLTPEDLTPCCPENPRVSGQRGQGMSSAFGGNRASSAGTAAGG